jgi:hypothetical protein
VPEISHLALAVRNWSLDLFPHSLEPSFPLRPLDRHETSLLLLRAFIPRKLPNLCITMGLVAGAPTSARVAKIMSRHIPRNMHESKELRLVPLLVVAQSR